MENLLAAERRKIILEKLQNDKKVIVSQLSAFFSVSDETIRRDIDKLCQEGFASKSYGGAILNENAVDMPFNIRKTQNQSEKKIIAEHIEKLVKDGESIMLDASTTAVFVARALKSKSRLTVLTNSIEVMLELSDKPEWTIIAAGGHLIGDYLAFTGQRTIKEISTFRADKLIFSCKGIDSEGIFDSNDDFAQVKQAMLKSAKTKILAVDSSKFDSTAFYKITDFADVDILITDTCPADTWVELLRESRVELIEN